MRHLRLVQFYRRLWFRIAKPKPDLSPPPSARLPSNTWHLPARREPSLIGPDSFRFLGENGVLSEIGWDGPIREKLWRYNQHYFDDLNATGANERIDWQRELLCSWIQCNPPGVGTGWEPYPTSLRIVNWVKWAQAGNELPEACLHSLAVQTRWLEKRLELHLLGNHLFANAKALMFAGLFFDGPEADKWLNKALHILANEVPEQILLDGGHFERSTMYHSLVLEDMLDLINEANTFANCLSLSQQFQISGWKQRAQTMRKWLQTMCHTDGEISLFNDSAFNIAPKPAELEAYAGRIFGDTLPHTSASQIHLKDSGYVRLAYGPAVALLDIAPVGPDYLLGHAHADTLSFELSVGKQRVLVNSGTSCYGNSGERLRQRGTAAHNTVVVDGQNSSEVWGGFRVARRAYPLDLQIKHSEGSYTHDSEIHCAHSGYSHLNGSPIHHRTWRMDEHNLSVADKVVGLHRIAEARFHFHPDAQIHLKSQKIGGQALFPNGTALDWRIIRGEGRLETSTWHPCFGSSISNTCLTVKLIDGASMLRFSWKTIKPTDLPSKNN